MLLTDTRTGEDGSPAVGVTRSTPAAIVNIGVRSAVAAFSGLILTCGVGLLLWAITPSAGAGAETLLRAGVSAFGLANGMTLAIGPASLTLAPLLVTMVAIALLAGVSGSGRVVGSGRRQELLTTITAALVYAAVVAGAGTMLGSPGSVRAGQWWKPALLAFVVVGGATLTRGNGWRPYLAGRLPAWVGLSVRLGAAGVMMLLGGGAVTLLIGLVHSFNSTLTVAGQAAPGAAGGFGMALLSIAYLPNAVVAATGYATGVGFSIGSGTYSLFGSTPTEPPSMSLVIAAPQGTSVERPTLLLLLLPLLAAVLIGRGAVRRLERRVDRLCAAIGAGVVAAAAAAVVAEVAGGGVTGGSWPTSGVEPMWFALVVGTGLGGVGAAVAAAARASVPTAGESAEAPTGDEPVAADPVAKVPDLEPSAAGAEVRLTPAADQVPEVEPAVVEAPVDEPRDDHDVADGLDADPATVPPPVREEDLLAATEAETDSDLVADLDLRRSPRQAG